MNKDILVYISGPITPKNGHSVERNIADALPVYFDCLRQGWPAHLPHLGAIYPTAHMVLSYEEWLQFDFAIISRSTHVLMLPRWETSSGCVREKEFAESMGLPVFEDIGALKACIEA